MLQSQTAGTLIRTGRLVLRGVFPERPLTNLLLVEPRRPQHRRQNSSFYDDLPLKKTLSGAKSRNTDRNDLYQSVWTVRFLFAAFYNSA